MSFVPALSFLHLERDGDVRVDLHVVPNASRTETAGLHGEPGREALRLRLKAPPVDGKANAALVRWLADSLGVPARHVALVRGETSRRKQLRIAAAALPMCNWAALTAASATQADTPLA